MRLAEVFVLRVSQNTTDANGRQLILPDATEEDFLHACFRVEVPSASGVLLQGNGERPVFGPDVESLVAIDVFRPAIHLLIALGDEIPVVLVLHFVARGDDAGGRRPENGHDRSLVCLTLWRRRGPCRPPAGSRRSSLRAPARKLSRRTGRVRPSTAQRYITLIATAYMHLSNSCQTSLSGNLQQPSAILLLVDPARQLAFATAATAAATSCGRTAFVRTPAATARSAVRDCCLPERFRLHCSR